MLAEGVQRYFHQLPKASRCDRLVKLGTGAYRKWLQPCARSTLSFR